MAPGRYVAGLGGGEHNIKVFTARFGIPHKTTESDVIEYQGEKYYIPEGSIIFAVQWAIEHDSSRFTDPDRFMPSRFLDSEGELKTDYETSAFGYGRRVCPGIPFVERTLWIAIATMLWTFNISGNEEPDPKTGLPFHYDTSDVTFLPGVSTRPRNFPAVFRSRSETRAEVARREWNAYEKNLRVLLPALYFTECKMTKCVASEIRVANFDDFDSIHVTVLECIDGPIALKALRITHEDLERDR
ncbi:hypothetical protein H0H92_005325 [Tricholoma furcatifolium]|nr:hypothetical protein H0H92_005325 [Tricholoma furcatifolium]